MTASALPKAELHLHIEGTLEPAMVLALARRNRVEVPWTDVGQLTAAYSFSDLSHFLELYYRCTAVLRTAEDFHDLADAYLVRAAQDGVRHVEMFVDPQAHLDRGVPLAEVMEGLGAARDAAGERHGISVGLIACFLRDRGPAAATRALEQLVGWREQLLGVGLDSAEVGHPPAAFREVFEAAAGMGLHRVAHAGEEGPPEYVWEALDVLGVERIDHGIRAVEDVALMRRLAADRVPLTVCPLSNVRLRAVPSLAEHPLPMMLEQGLHVTLNSDDPAYFGGYLAANYDAVAAALVLDDAQLRSLAASSFEASFLPPAEIERHVRSIADH